MTAFGKKHLARIHELSCGLCDAMPVEVHHILEGRVKGRKSGHWTAIPLCVSCHRGQFGIHGDQTMLRIHKSTELELLGDTLERLYGH